MAGKSITSPASSDGSQNATVRISVSKSESGVTQDTTALNSSVERAMIDSASNLGDQSSHDANGINRNGSGMGDEVRGGDTMSHQTSESFSAEHCSETVGEAPAPSPTANVDDTPSSVVSQGNESLSASSDGSGDSGASSSVTKEDRSTAEQGGHVSSTAVSDSNSSS
ncbi:uncharacterized protein LOC142353028 isoform X1 [Convolutriloba macropyga]|uniref:uncharacterized protein LOC142353028 isoform X1 n=1 Tax=Convolutriloba macropyga TaxID=536237 RepID=UPI003F5260BD